MSAVKPWTPAIGEWVIYRAHPNAQAEDGTVTSEPVNGMVKVRYWAANRVMSTYVISLRPAKVAKTYGMCLACGAIEVSLVEATGMRDFSSIGESPYYPTGYGCELCS